MGVLKKNKKQFILSALTALLVVTAPLTGFAASGDKEAVKKDGKEKKEEQVVPEIELNSESVFLYDMNLGEVIYEKNADSIYPTASLAKIMTLSLASDFLEEGKVKKTDKVKISEKSWKTGGSRMFLEVGRTVPFEELFKGVAVVSGNDASVAIAEHLAGSTEKFAKMMNNKAKKLNMKNTKFVSPNGLPISDDVTDTSTARDLGLMTIDYLTKYSGNLKVHSMKEYAFDTGRDVITQANRNPILSGYKGADGLKTGFIDDHYNFIGTAERDGIRLIVVTMKATSDSERKEDAVKLLDYGFEQYKKYKLANKDERVGNIQVYKAKDLEKTEVYMADDVRVVIHASKLEDAKVRKEIELPDYLNASKEIKAGDKVGTVKFYSGKKLLAETDLIVKKDIEEGSFFKKTVDSFSIFGKWLSGIFN